LKIEDGGRLVRWDLEYRLCVTWLWPIKPTERTWRMKILRYIPQKTEAQERRCHGGWQGKGTKSKEASGACGLWTVKMRHAPCFLCLWYISCSYMRNAPYLYGNDMADIVQYQSQILILIRHERTNQAAFPVGSQQPLRVMRAHFTQVGPMDHIR
jgi:hypothetical protein